ELQADAKKIAVSQSNTLFAISKQNRIIAIPADKRTWSDISGSLDVEEITNLVSLGNRLFALNADRRIQLIDFSETYSSETDWLHSDLNDVIVNSMVSTSAGLFVASDTGGIFFSANGISNWTQRNNGLAGLDVLELLEGNSGRLFAATNGTGIFRSDDDGISWSSSSSGLSGQVVLSMASGPNGEIYAGTVFGGVYRSEDNGETWQNKSDPTLFSTIVYKMAVGQNGEIFAGTAGEGLYRSQDSGENWEIIGLSGIDVRTLEPDITGGFLAGAWFDGIYRYSGINWTQIALPNTHVMDIIEAGPYLFAASHGAGIFRSEDEGTTWQSFNGGLSNGGVWSFVQDNNGYVYAGTNGSGVFRTQSAILTGLEPQDASRLQSFELKQNYPNPFNPSTQIEFTLQKSGTVYLDVIDAIGRTVAVLVDDSRSAGQYRVSFNGSGVASGIYVYRMQFDGRSEIRKMLLVK
ncbi:MAG: two-component regulator propeller domain-containing protein, partial [Calditrichota bacterium]